MDRYLHGVVTNRPKKDSVKTAFLSDRAGHYSGRARCGGAPPLSGEPKPVNAEEVVKHVLAAFEEHEEADRVRYDELVRKLDVVDRHIGEVAKEVEAVEFEIGGAPRPAFRGNRSTIRSRLHHLENDAAAARIAAEALQASSAERRGEWSRVQKVALFLFAVIAAIEGAARLLGYG